MVFVLVIAVIVIAAWLYMARSANQDATAAARNRSSGIDDYVPVNAYDNPYDTNEANDRPFEPDTCSDSSNDSSSVSGSDSCGDTGDSSSD